MTPPTPCPTCKRPKPADAVCVYCGALKPRDATPEAASSPGQAAAPAAPKLAPTCTNCGDRRPRNVPDDAADYRCFNCGAVNVAGTATTARGMTVHVAHESLGAPRQLTLPQREAFDGLSWGHIAFLASFIPLAVASAVAAKSVTWLWPLNDASVLVWLGVVPLLAIATCTILGALLTRRASRRFEALFAAIPPREAGARVRCHGCGDPLRASEQKIVRCSRCGSDNLTSLAVARRAGKSAATISPEGSNLFASEAAFAHEALLRARSRTKLATLALPALALIAYGVTAWNQDFRVPLVTEHSLAVVALASCNMIVPPSGAVSDGWTRTEYPIRGLLAVDGRVPVAYNQLLEPDALIGKLVIPEGGAPSPVQLVYRSLRSEELRMRVQTGAGTRELPVIGACIDEPAPYRAHDGVTAAEREAAEAKRRAAEELRRRALQGQLHAPAEPTLENGEAP